jgi:uncharacterized protein YdeI (YjbR/CyaY-like superfamily)
VKNIVKKASPNSTLNPKVDAYIEQSAAFAQPVLTHLRSLMHKGCPPVEEAIKWSRPFFLHRGVILGNMSAFQQHCSFGFWGEEIGAVLRETNALQTDGMGSLGRIVRVQDLPSDKLMLEWIRQAAAFVESGEHTSPITARRKVVKSPKAPVETPDEFAAALKKNKKAATVFAAFSPSGKGEYVEWIADAKRPETKQRRIATALEWIAEGKQRNWKYQAG